MTKKNLHLEGLRGVAAFIVFIAHFRPTFCRYLPEQIMDHFGITNHFLRGASLNFLSVFYGGDLQVFIFWLMSAYVISIKLFDLKRNENNRYLVEASTKRYFRLAIPVFFSSLLCFVLLKSHLIFNIQLSEKLGPGYADDWLNKWYHFDPGIIHFLKTTIIQVFMPGNCNYNIALWTMNPELMGSFLCFGLFAVMGRNKNRFIVYIASVIFLTVAGFMDVTYFYYLMFVLGLMWSDVYHSADTNTYLKDFIRKIYESKLTVIVLLVLGFGVTIYSDTVKPIHEKLYYFFSLPVKAVAFTLLVDNFRRIGNLFSTKPFVFFGKISFSFYLLHIPIMFSLGIYLYLYQGMQSAYGLLSIFLILAVVTTVVAYFFMKFIDKKAISVSDRVGKFFSGRAD